MLALGQVLATPFCTMLLTDMSARVIKIESLEQAKERLSLGMKRVRNGVESIFVGPLGHAKDELEQWREAGVIGYAVEPPPFRAGIEGVEHEALTDFSADLQCTDE